MDINGKKIILGSNSPRRRELLAGLNIPFVVDTRNTFEESIPDNVAAEQIPSLMSEGKSLGFWRQLEEDEILITSDTLVLCDDKPLGKPTDREDAVRMLKILSDREHHVITAVTFRDKDKTETVADTTAVRFKSLDDDEIAYYLDTFKPYDKAGAYGVQEWIGYIAISGINGSFYNVMGLPVHLVYEVLKRFVKD